MGKQHPGSIEAAARRRKARRRAEDILLLPLTLLLMLFDYVIWNGARALLTILSRHRWIAALRCWLQSLPPIAVVFLFLVPELVDHLGGLWATVMLVKGQVVPAAFIAVFIKGFAALVAIWIYQSCEESLLSVEWFRRLHDQVLKGYAWVQARTAPLRTRLRLIGRSGRLGRRATLWRIRLSARFGITR